MKCIVKFCSAQGTGQGDFPDLCPQHRDHVESKQCEAMRPTSLQDGYVLKWKLAKDLDARNTVRDPSLIFTPVPNGFVMVAQTPASPDVFATTDAAEPEHDWAKRGDDGYFASFMCRKCHFTWEWHQRRGTPPSSAVACRAEAIPVCLGPPR